MGGKGSGPNVSMHLDPALWAGVKQAAGGRGMSATAYTDAALRRALGQPAAGADDRLDALEGGLEELAERLGRLESFIEDVREGRFRHD